MPEIARGEKQAALKRFGEFPFQYYWEVFNPVTATPEEPVCGAIADDFADIYCDVKSGLLAYDLGRHPQVVWCWRFCGAFIGASMQRLHSRRSTHFKGAGSRCALLGCKAFTGSSQAVGSFNLCAHYLSF
jgi:hypothetical protein